ncbi:hypothetical protein Z043_115158 [Scleropages formosus]|uniref:IRS-type PTB domain-containing protein n=1 Tax=Scleropages formosus TaxID=113540 RepID=A0A0P7TY27_SCLFO|nr:hypothetical protein Z043_115158 [Scleropages formosus]
MAYEGVLHKDFTSSPCETPRGHATVKHDGSPCTREGTRNIDGWISVINVDDDGNELGSGTMELTEDELILHTRKRDAVKWPYLCLRRYGYDSNLFSFESGRRCQTGQGIFAFKCARAEELFNMLQDVMHSNSISVVEEPVQDVSHGPAEPEQPCTPRTPTTPGYTAPALPNGIPHPRYPSFGDTSSRPSSRHPSVGSTRLPSVGEESTHPLLVADETCIHPQHNWIL